MNQKTYEIQILQYVRLVFDTFVELRGDRKSGDDSNILGGLARIGEYKSIIIGYNWKESSEADSADKPEGYRKSQRLMDMAETFKKPFIAFIDIPQYHILQSPLQQQRDSAMVQSLSKISHLKVPTISVIVGRSNGMHVFDLCATDRVLMLDNSICFLSSAYLVNKSRHSKSLHLKAQDMMEMGIVNKIIKSFPDNQKLTSDAIRQALLEELYELGQCNLDELVKQRVKKLQYQFRVFGNQKL